jgi:periplasmic divalent cation tolerance protein
MAESSYMVVLITTGSLEEARRIADVLVQQRKAACVNIVPQVSSMYRWEGRIQEDEESLMIVKTRAELLPEVVDSVRAAHSYEVPEIIALPVAGGNQDYLDWLGRETGQP